MTVTEIYNQSVKPLSPADRLRLAAMILNEIPPQSVVDYSEQWTEGDLKDFAQSTWRSAADPEEKAGNG